MEHDVNEDPFGDIDELVSQLKQGTPSDQQLDNIAEKMSLDKSELEQFILDNQSTLIKDSVDVLQIMKQYVASAPNAEDIGSFAELLKATSTAIDNLTKLHTSNQRVDTQVKLKRMDIEAKKEINQDNNKMKLIGTREEIFKKMLEDSITVEAEVTDTEIGSTTIANDSDQ